MILHEMATIWALANCSSAKVQTNFVEQLIQATLRQVNCSFAVGRKLTKSKKPYLVYCFSGELFVFELSPDQATRLGMDANGLVYGENALSELPIAKAEPTVLLREVKVDEAMKLDRNSPITGTLQYEAKQVSLQPVCIRAKYEPPGRNSVTKYHHLFHLAPREGTIRFSLAPIGDLPDRSDKPFAGLLPVFFRIWTDNQAQKLQIPEPMPGKLGRAYRASPRTLQAPPQMLPPGIHNPQSNSPPLPDAPISDIRAVLVDVT